MIVAIDPGHSGPFEPGAIGPNGTREADITMQAGEMLAEELTQRGISPLLTRTGAIENDDLSWRAELANENNAAAFISIHCNAAENPAAEGYEIFTSPGQDESDCLAECIFDEIETAFPDFDQRADGSDGDRDKEANFTVITRADCPAVLIELAFISNPREEQYLRNPAFLRKYVQAIATGIARFCEVA